MVHLRDRLVSSMGQIAALAVLLFGGSHSIYACNPSYANGISNDDTYVYAETNILDPDGNVIADVIVYDPLGNRYELDGSLANGSETTNIQLDINGMSGTWTNDGVTWDGSEYVPPPAQLTVNGPPAYMQVVQDYQNICSGCTTTVARVTTYQVMQANGTNVGNIAICETLSDSMWNCSQSAPTVDSLACGTPPGGTTSTGQFTDIWSLNANNFTPVGCGFQTATDVWKRANIDGSFTAFGTLNGALMTTSTTINGHTIVGASTDGAMPMGFRINP
jgi:hypothetical protein